MTKIEEMNYAQFVEAVRPTAAINRWPQLGREKEVMSYSVYMNGPLVDSMPESARVHEFRDVTIHALTAKLGLDPLSYRDNQKVAEIVASRNAYQSCLMEAKFVTDLSNAAIEEYFQLSDELNHPYIQQQIEEHKTLDKRLQPLLDQARKALGGYAIEAPAGGVRKGEVLSQDTEYTVQSIGDGKIVAHRNSALDHVPAVGADVTVAYYKGKGQVIDRLNEVSFSKSYVDELSGDLAVQVLGHSGEVRQVVLFSNMVMIAEFAKEHHLDADFVRHAMDVREANPKRMAPRPERVPVGHAFLDEDTGCIALDFKEGSVVYTALFNDAKDLQEQAVQFGASAAIVESAHQVQQMRNRVESGIAERSLQDAFDMALKSFSDVSVAQPENGERFGGRIAAATWLHVVQDTGRGSAKIHDVRNLDKVPFAGERGTIAYKNGRGEVKLNDIAQNRSRGRD